MPFKSFILVCGGSGCEADGAQKLYDAFQKELEKNNAAATVQVLQTCCLGYCAQGPVVKILPDQTVYVTVKAEDAAEIVTSHLLAGKPVARLRYDNASTLKQLRFDNCTYSQKQFRIVLRNCGVIDPEKIDEYIARDGYAALSKVLSGMRPEEVIAELKTSGLRGRGGAGFPTWMKWDLTRKEKSDVKYVVCNADEGDPGAYMDRSTLEGDPHSILEAMAIGGYSIGAGKGYIYIRAEYPLAIKRLEIAIAQAREYGLLGNNILGTNFSFDIDIRLGAGAFVCGEETALLTSIEGNRGMPRPRPPFPAVKGLFGRPTVINNVETLANIPVIINRGGDWFAKIGTETSKGTKVFALTGKIRNTGLIEVPMGTTLRDIIYNIGGGINNNKKFKAVQTGGPSGGVITADFLDTAIDYNNLQQLGSIMGSGGMIVMDEDDCIVDITKFYLKFSVDESCGKCAPCRIGGRQLLDYMDKISSGKGTIEDIEDIKEIAFAMQKASLCGLGQTTPNPVVSTLKYFNDEYMAHINEQRCPAHKCKALVSYSILPDKCIGCGVCARHCPVNVISGEKRSPHVIDSQKCIKCGECFKACKFGAVEFK
jgi:NADP-reducing hydrogenase subunit HndC